MDSSVEIVTGSLPATDSPSPLHSSEESSYHAEAYDDQDLDASMLADDGDDDGKQKGRVVRITTTAERRATHNAVERARRETLNSRFMDLAAALPNMSNIKRPSKSAIVNKSIDYVRTSQAREAALTAQNDALRVEVNELRARLGLGPLTSTPASAPLHLPPLRHREPSIGSLSVHTEGTSPLLSAGASPNNTTTDFVASPLTAGPAASANFPPQFVSAANAVNAINLLRSFGHAPPAPTTPVDARRMSFHGTDGIVPQATTAPAAKAVASSVPATPAFGAGPFTPLDLGYLMGLQHQAVQAQAALNPVQMSVMNMQTGGHNLAGFGAWENSFAHSVPVSAGGGNDAMNWLFA